MNRPHSSCLSSTANRGPSLNSGAVLFQPRGGPGPDCHRRFAVPFLFDLAGPGGGFTVGALGFSVKLNRKV